MIEVSEAARVTLQLVLDTLLEEEREEKHQYEGVPASQLGLRLGVSASGNIAFRLDLVHSGDEIVSHEGDNVLLVDAEMSRRFDGATLDCTDTAAGPRLTISF